MTKKYVVVDLGDERVSNLANILSNKTARKIVEFIADGEVSEGDIASSLKLPANTVNYNVKKLLDSGVIEKSKKFLWSEKGKKIYFYQVANRSIVISPKKLFNFNKIIPLIIFLLLGTFIVVMLSGGKCGGLYSNCDYFGSEAGIVYSQKLADEAQPLLMIDSGGIGSSDTGIAEERVAKGSEDYVVEGSEGEQIRLNESQNYLAEAGAGFWFFIGGIFMVFFAVLVEYYYLRKQ
jgi:DNA-binding transcriptional ArsR family regulator